MMLTGIYDQLEELESVLEASFSDLRTSLNREEEQKLVEPVQRLSELERKCASTDPFADGEFSDSTLSHQPLKLELGF